MKETYFEILVYTCRQSQLVERVEREAERVMADVPDYGNGFWEEQKESEIQRHLYPIRFNEVVGTIEVHKLGTQLRADWWFTRKKRVAIGGRSRGEIRYIGKLLEKVIAARGKVHRKSLRTFENPWDSRFGPIAG